MDRVEAVLLQTLGSAKQILERRLFSRSERVELLMERTIGVVLVLTFAKLVNEFDACDGC